MVDAGPLARLQTALDEVERVAADNVARGLLIQQRVREMRSRLDEGRPLLDIVADEYEPRTVELITANMGALEAAGARFRAGLAWGLRDEGLTVEAIGTLFGVSRQRISALLRQKAAGEERADDAVSE